MDSRALRQKLTKRVLSKATHIPTSSWGRLGRTALTGMRTGKMMLGNKWFGTLSKAAEGEEIDVEALVRIIVSVGRLKGLVMKMGQIMSYIDVALPEELSVALGVLQTQSQPMPIDRVNAIIREDLGDKAENVLQTIEPIPIAAASIGQVHRATIDGTSVAVKIQYPEIATAILSDFAPATAISKILAKIYPHAKVADFIDEMKTRLLEECDYIHEARAQSKFGELFKDHPVIVIPDVHQSYCSKHVLTSTYMEGLHFEEFLATHPPQELRDSIGKALFEFYIETLFRHKLYNCDPHPGNYLFLPDNRIAMLDYGCTRRFEDDFVQKLALLTTAVHRDDPDELRHTYLKVGIVEEGQSYDYEIVRELIRGFFGPMLEDKEQKIDLGSMSFKEMAAKKMEINKLALPSEFLFLLRIRFGLMSVLSRLGASANWKELESRCIALVN